MKSAAIGQPRHLQGTLQTSREEKSHSSPAKKQALGLLEKLWTMGSCSQKESLQGDRVTLVSIPKGTGSLLSVIDTPDESALKYADEVLATLPKKTKEHLRELSQLSGSCDFACLPKFYPPVIGLVKKVGGSSGKVGTVKQILPVVYQLDDLLFKEDLSKKEKKEKVNHVKGAIGTVLKACKKDPDLSTVEPELRSLLCLVSSPEGLDKLRQPCGTKQELSPCLPAGSNDYEFISNLAYSWGDTAQSLYTLRNPALGTFILELEDVIYDGGQEESLLASMVEITNRVETSIENHREELKKVHRELVILTNQALDLWKSYFELSFDDPEKMANDLTTNWESLEQAQEAFTYEFGKKGKDLSIIVRAYCQTLDAKLSFLESYYDEEKKKLEEKQQQLRETKEADSEELKKLKRERDLYQRVVDEYSEVILTLSSAQKEGSALLRNLSEGLLYVPTLTRLFFDKFRLVGKLFKPIFQQAKVRREDVLDKTRAVAEELLKEEEEAKASKASRATKAKSKKAKRSRNRAAKKAEARAAKEVEEKKVQELYTDYETTLESYQEKQKQIRALMRASQPQDAPLVKKMKNLSLSSSTPAEPDSTPATPGSTKELISKKADAIKALTSPIARAPEDVIGLGNLLAESLKVQQGVGQVKADWFTQKTEQIDKTDQEFVYEPYTRKPEVKLEAAEEWVASQAQWACDDSISEPLRNLLIEEAAFRFAWLKTWTEEGSEHTGK